MQQRLIYGGKQMYVLVDSPHGHLDTLQNLILTAVPYRADDKTAEEYKLEGGATLHLVLALRGGCDAM